MLQMIGEETELDKGVIERIGDPLTHLVRNAADHGIESPEDRRTAGKPEQGVIRLQAYHQGGNVIIEVADELQHASAALAEQLGSDSDEAVLKQQGAHLSRCS